MKVVCYYAPTPNGHPHCTLDAYDRLFPIMARSVARQGYEWVHLTSLDAPAKSEHVVRYDVDASRVMFSREVAWQRFLAEQDDTEQVALIEPDAYLLRPIPPLTSGDMLLLRRPGASLPCGFRLATRRSLPFYDAVVERYAQLPADVQRFHGDVQVHQQLLGIPNRGAGSIPAQFGSVRIEVRDYLDYTDRNRATAVAWNFKGSSKPLMEALP